MNASHLLSLTVLIVSLFSSGRTVDATDDVSNNDESDSNNEGALSREKRGSFKMMRLGRGLRMLRLGKRGSPDVPETPHDVETLLALLQGYYEQLPETAEDFSSEGVEEFHPRYRRSTPSTEEVATTDMVPDGVEDINESEGLINEEQEGTYDGEYAYYPEDFSYEDLEDIYEPQEGGDNLNKDSFENAGTDFENKKPKRAISMLRLGKRPMSMLRLGKRPMSMLRLGKRPMSMLRLGKRPMSMLRLGKRPMSMLRLGKRPMSMLRLGKRPMSMLRLGKRPMSMLRLGKRPMSMLRLGKRPMSTLGLGIRPMSRDVPLSRGLRMLRLGKRSTDDEESNDKSA